MVVIYRLLGAIARFNERLSHYRVNFIPINFGVMALLCGASLFGLIEFSEGISNGDKPVPRTVAEVLNRKDMSRSFVTVTKTGTETPSLSTAQAALTPEQNVDLRVTGRFALDQRNAKRFLNVPAAIATTGGGEMVIVSNIDASSKLYGITTQKLAGLWTIVLQPTGLQQVEMGQLYDGLNIRPALRIRYREGNSGTASAILSFANPAERETVLNELHRFAGYTMVRS